MSTHKKAENDDDEPQELSFSFRGKQVPVTWSAAVTLKEAAMTLKSKPFQTWVRRIAASTTTTNQDEPQRQITIHSVELQSVDLSGARGVGFCKVKSRCTLEVLQPKKNSPAKQHCRSTEPPPFKQAKTHHDGGDGDDDDDDCSNTIISTTTLPGICLLRGDAVAILVALFCTDEMDYNDNDDNINDNAVYSLLVEQPR
mgnify:CR=1 FL=1